MKFIMLALSIIALLMAAVAFQYSISALCSRQYEETLEFQTLVNDACDYGACSAHSIVEYLETTR